jgi:hypothetical protein
MSFLEAHFVALGIMALIAMAIAAGAIQNICNVVRKAAKREPVELEEITDELRLIAENVNQLYFVLEAMLTTEQRARLCATTGQLIDVTLSMSTVTATQVAGLPGDHS